jgi:predicted phage-related endonuclease
MSSKPNPLLPEAFDPLTATRAELTVLQERLASDMENKKAELERFKEETLWRLNAMSDRTVEIAHMEENGVEARLAQDEAEADSRLAKWRAQVYERVHDERLLDDLAKKFFERLLPKDLSREEARAP